MPMNPSIAERRGFGRPLTDDDDDLVRESALYPTMALIGRFLLAAIFLVSGISKLTDLPGTVAHMTKAGIPYADTLAIVAGVAEVLGAVSLVAGFLARIGGFGLILFMIPATLIFHAFWNYEGQERLPQMINFMKNLAIMGGLAMVVAFGAGRYSVDRAMHRSPR
jgi:putative oxidoreductase